MVSATSAESYLFTPRLNLPRLTLYMHYLLAVLERIVLLYYNYILHLRRRLDKASTQ